MKKKKKFFRSNIRFLNTNKRVTNKFKTSRYVLIFSYRYKFALVFWYYYGERDG